MSALDVLKISLDLLRSHLDPIYVLQQYNKIAALTKGEMHTIAGQTGVGWSPFLPEFPSTFSIKENGYLPATFAYKLMIEGDLGGEDGISLAAPAYTYAAYPRERYIHFFTAVALDFTIASTVSTTAYHYQNIKYYGARPFYILYEAGETLFAKYLVINNALSNVSTKVTHIAGPAMWALAYKMPEEYALKCTDYLQVQAWRDYKISPAQALLVNDTDQLIAFACFNLPFDTALQFTKSSQVRALQVMPWQKALEFTEDCQVALFMSGESADTALNSNCTTSQSITNSVQAKDRELAPLCKQSLQFNNEMVHILAEALKNGAPLEVAPQFINYIQTSACKHGVPGDKALKFSDWLQVDALQCGVSAEQALQVTRYCQIKLLLSGQTADEVIKSNCAELASDSSDRAAHMAAVMWARALKMPEKYVFKFTDYLQVQAWRDYKISPAQALLVNDTDQLIAFACFNLPFDTALQFTKSSQVRTLQVMPWQKALEFTEDCQVALLMAGKSEYTALNSNCTTSPSITNSVQARDHELAPLCKQSLRFNDGMANILVAALENGVPLEVAPQFVNYVQASAYKHGAPADKALKFNNWVQVDALEAGASAEQALQFTYTCQVEVLLAGHTADEAIKSNCGSLKQ